MSAEQKPPPPVIERVGDEFSLHFGTQERRLIITLLEQLRDLLTSGQGAEITRRLHPPAYHLVDDSEAEAEYQRLMNEELVASRLGAIQVVIDALNQPSDWRCTDDTIIHLMTSVNSVRLVLGTMLDVGEDDEEYDEEHPDADRYDLYELLGYFVAVAVKALTEPTTG